jgi:hypothetical protein
MTTFDTMPNHKIHEARNVKSFREMLGIKQDALAAIWAMTGTSKRFLCWSKKKP